jgi:hypothetical protein
MPADRVEEWRTKAIQARAEHWRGASKTGTGPAANPTAELLRQLFFYVGSTRTLRSFAAAKSAFAENA